MRSRHLFAYPVLALLIGYAWIIPSGKAMKHLDNNQKTTPSANCFVCISDLHLDNSDSPSEHGCDTHLDLWNSFIKKLANVIETGHPKFIVCTGDLPAHLPNPWCHQKDKAVNLLKVMTALDSIITKYKIPFYFAPGNNDVIDGNYGSFSDHAGKNIFSFYKEKTGRAFPVQETANGYYSENVNDKLEIISLNTIRFSSKYSGDQSDKQSELLWLDKQLDKLHNRKAYIIMHIPPGFDAYQKKDMWIRDSLNLFLNIINKHSASIAGIISGHTHNDEIRLLYAPDNKRIMQVAMSCPGISPDHKGISQNNPGFKLVHYDPETFRIRDFTTYYTQVPVKDQQWSSYSFSQIFGCDSLNSLKHQPLDSVKHKIHSIFWVDGVYHENTFPDAAVEVKYGR